MSNKTKITFSHRKLHLQWQISCRIFIISVFDFLCFQANVKNRPILIYKSNHSQALIDEMTKVKWVLWLLQLKFDPDCIFPISYYICKSRQTSLCSRSHEVRKTTVLNFILLAPRLRQHLARMVAWPSNPEKPTRTPISVFQSIDRFFILTDSLKVLSYIPCVYYTSNTIYFQAT